MAQYVTCEYCKSNLDPGEKCDCQENMKQANQNIVIGNTVHTCSSKLLNTKRKEDCFEERNKRKIDPISSYSRKTF